MDIVFFILKVAMGSLLMTIVVVLIAPFTKEQKNMGVRASLIYAVMLVPVLLICLGNQPSVTSAKQKQDLSALPVTTSVPAEKKVVEKPAPFAKPADEDNKSSKVAEEVGKIDASFFNLVDPPSADGHFADGTAYFNYEVRSGDTVFGISKEFNIEDEELKARNGLKGEDPIIYVGNSLKVTIVN